MKLKPKKWADFQHYKDRCPPWIKLQKSLLDDFDFHRLHVASRALAPMLWLLASESTDGVFDADIDRLSFRLRMDKAELRSALNGLITNGFFTVVQDASSTLAECLQDAVPETETETETDTQHRVARFCFKTALLELGADQSLVADWMAVRKTKKASNTKTALDSFMREVNKAGYTVDQALRLCCKKDWKGFDAEWVKDIKPVEPRSIDHEEIARKRAADIAAAREAYRREQEANTIPLRVAK